MNINLRNASILKAEREQQFSQREKTSFEHAMKRAVDRIEEAHASGGTSFSDLTYPDSVVKALEQAGYKVKLFPACGMGDMDSHEVSWG
jgi:hypothetical protein